MMFQQQQSSLNPYMLEDLENCYAKQEIKQCRTLHGAPSNPTITQVPSAPFESSYETVYEVFPLGRPSQVEYFVQEPGQVRSSDDGHYSIVDDENNSEYEDEDGEDDQLDSPSSDMEEGDVMRILHQEFNGSVERQREIERGILKLDKTTRRQLEKVSLRRRLDEQLRGLLPPEDVRCYEEEIRQKMGQAYRRRMSLEHQLMNEVHVRQLVKADMESLLRQVRRKQSRFEQSMQTSNLDLAFCSHKQDTDNTDMSSGVLEEGIESTVDNDSDDYAILKVRAKDWLVESTSEETQERNNNNACSQAAGLLDMGRRSAGYTVYRPSQQDHNVTLKVRTEWICKTERYVSY